MKNFDMNNNPTTLTDKSLYKTLWQVKSTNGETLFESFSESEARNWNEINEIETKNYANGEMRKGLCYQPGYYLNAIPKFL